MFGCRRERRIERTSEVVGRIEKLLANRKDIQSIAAFIGQGPPRFYLPVEPEKPYSSYGQLIVSLKDFRDAEKLMHEIDVWAGENLADAEVIPRKYGLGPSETWSVRLRISGPAVADSATLRRLADEAKEIIAASPQAKVVRTDWRQRVPTIVAEYDITNGRWTNVNRKGIADATRRAFDGVTVGQYREKDKLLPIVLRALDSERDEAAATLPTLQVSSALGGNTDSTWAGNTGHPSGMGGPSDLALGQAAGSDGPGGSGWAGNRVTNAGAGGENLKDQASARLYHGMGWRIQKCA